ncbi:MAG: hypothetical protein LBI92_02225 [Azoarcus sp.]|jgi:energy-coupling factor transporter ATP-binding protein EcfA2|nr:hypothetical protein [Azoarcus sp.]
MGDSDYVQKTALEDALLSELKDSTITKGCGKNILLAGPWGSGKTRLLEHLQQRLKDNTDFFVICFSPSENTTTDNDPRLSFWNNLYALFLSNTLKEKKNEPAKMCLERLCGWMREIIGEIRSPKAHYFKYFKRKMGAKFIQMGLHQYSTDKLIETTKAVDSTFGIILLPKLIQTLIQVNGAKIALVLGGILLILITGSGLLIKLFALSTGVISLASLKKGALRKYAWITGGILFVLMAGGCIEYNNKCLEIIKNFITLLAGIVAFVLLLAGVLIKPVNKNTPITESRKIIKDLLSDIRNITGAKHLLLLVDDFDRMLPDKAVKIFDELQCLFMPYSRFDPRHEETWPLTSIWAVNTSILEEYLYSQHGNMPSFDPNAYLEKIFDCRIRVPIIGIGSTAVTANLWEESLSPVWYTIINDADVKSAKDVASELSKGVRYKALDNFRTFNRIRDEFIRCIRNGLIRQMGELWKNRNNNGDVITTDEKVTRVGLVRIVRLIVVANVFRSFHENIALYEGNWEIYINLINQSLGNPQHPTSHPWCRFAGDPDLITLLGEKQLGAIKFDKDKYVCDDTGRTNLQHDLVKYQENGL